MLECEGVSVCWGVRCLCVLGCEGVSVCWGVRVLVCAGV